MRVARDVIGCVLAVDGVVRARIVEVEAYLGLADAASHAYRGPTPRAAIMFGRPGRLYVYLSYGVHCCANIVTERDGVAGAVLLRAAVVEDGTDEVRRRRAPRRSGAAVDAVRSVGDAALLRGPGNLCRGLGIDRGDNGADLCGGGGRFSLHAGDAQPPLATGPRIGITRARDEPLRFWWRGHPAVSRSGGVRSGIAVGAAEMDRPRR